jgi:hypothetical protein
VGCFCLYLLPTTAVSKPREVVRKAVSILAEQRIIWADPADTQQLTEGHFSFGCGENAHRAFDMETAAEAIPFETCFLFGAESPDVVPQCPGVDPKCPKCGGNVSSEYYEFVNEEKVAESFRCPHCGNTCRIDQLVDEAGIFITTLYLCFDDTDGEQLDAEWLREFSGRLGIQLIAKEYWYT